MQRAARSNASSVASGVPFENVFLKPFPLRAAIDIGTNGMLSLAIGRVDAAHHAVKELLHHTQLPLNLQQDRQLSAAARQFAAQEAGPSSAHRNREAAGAAADDSFWLSDASIADVVHQMHVATGIMRRPGFRGVLEHAAVLSYPLCMAVNARAIAATLEKTFQMPVRVVGLDYQPSIAQWWQQTHGKHQSDRQRKQGAKRRGRSDAPHKQQQADGRTQFGSNERTNDAIATVVPPLEVVRSMTECLLFQSLAAVSQCTARHRMLGIVEDQLHGTLRIVGLSSSPTLPHPLTAAEEVERGPQTDEAERMTRATRRGEEEEEELLRLDEKDWHQALQERGAGPVTVTSHVLPVTTLEAHRMLLHTIQRRESETYSWSQSPNPVQRSEFQSLVSLQTQLLQATLPPWVQRRSLSGGVICGTSVGNGSLLNIAARVSQQSMISLDHLETSSEFHYSGLTDVLLAANFPFPQFVLPQAALASGLMRALQTPRVHYLPEVSLAHGMLTSELLWSYDERDRIVASLANKRWYQNPQRRVQSKPLSRTFKGQPTQ